jgi:hypothetical protein
MKDFTERRSDECAYLVEHMKVCGEPIVKSDAPYCAEHRAMCYSGCPTRMNLEDLDPWSPKKKVSV